jgi:hypothetical protein
MADTPPTDSGARSPDTTQDLARQRIDDYRRQALNDCDPLIGALGHLSANLMDLLVAFEPQMARLLPTGVADRRRVAEQQHTLGMISKLNAHVIGYVRVITTLKNQNAGG